VSHRALGTTPEGGDPRREVASTRREDNKIHDKQGLGHAILGPIDERRRARNPFAPGGMFTHALEPLPGQFTKS
jgi:hypothetical protein